MSIYLYQKSCSSCSGNKSIEKMKQLCEKYDIDFQERRTILWENWEKEADEIMKLNPGLELPFFYNDKTGETHLATSLELLDELKNWIKQNEDTERHASITRKKSQ